MTEDTDRVRRFNRAVTTELGVLDTSFLGRGRPLGAARVLNAVGHGKTTVDAVREHLGLDSGLMSRLLRSLEDEELLETRPDRTDRRRRRLTLTEKGKAEFAAYEDLSDAQAARMLGRHPDRERLLAAFDLIATALGRDRIGIEERDPRDPASLTCLRAYYAELAERFRQGFDVSLSRDPEAEDMIHPRGVFLVAMSDGVSLGCVGLKGSGGPLAEIKRLWVSPDARGMGLARRLMGAAEDAATGLGIQTLRLDTNSALPEAEALYRNSGWTQIERFNDDPYPDLFFEKHLGSGM